MRIVSAGAAQALVGAIAARDGITVEGSFGAVGAMLEKFRGSEPCDVVILTRAQVDGLATEGLVASDTVTDLGMVPTAIAVRDGASIPDISNEEGLRATLLAADALFFPDPSKATAGIHFAKVLERLGIRSAVERRIRNFPNGATSMREMAQVRGRPVGCTQATEILATPGVRLVSPLPSGFELETIYTAAVSARAKNAVGARAFVTALGAPASRALRERAGFVLSSG
jgi:molybdate transport system substrate-binding protein